MRISRRLLPSVAAAAATALALSVGAAAHDGGHGAKHKSGHAKTVLDAALAPSQIGDDSFHGVGPGGAPWVLKAGEVKLESRGRLDLRVRGLVIPSPPGDGTPGPVNTIDASLYCGADTNKAAADTSKQVRISRKGNARIRDRSFHVPATCLAPVILVHPNGNMGAYIAVDGQRG